MSNRFMLRMSLGLVLGLIFGLISTQALAHESALHPAGFWSGLWHPVSGFDHLLVMLGVGSWAAYMQSQKPKQAYFMLPVAFLLCLLLGSILALNQWVLPTLEGVIALSVLLVGLILVSRAVLPFSIALCLISGFALWHGNAHGVEMASASSVLSFAIGFICASALLQTAGYALGQQAVFQKHWQNLLGIFSCLFGGGLMVVNSMV